MPHENANQQKDLQVYSKKKKVQELGANHPLEQNLVSNPSSKDDQRDVEQMVLPIALRKGICSCTHLPIGNYVAYENLSSCYKRFVANLTLEKVSQNIYEAQTGQIKGRHK